MWIFKQSQLNDSITFQVLEREFDEWENVLAFLSAQNVRLFSDTQQIPNKIPLDDSFMPFVVLLHQKIVLNEHILARNTSVNLDRLVELVKLVTQWHLQADKPKVKPTQ